MDTVQSFAEQKTRELLELCGITDYSLEPVKQLILDISKYACDTLAKSGMDVIPSNAPTEMPRGSYRLLSKSMKRGRLRYDGLDKAYNKRKRVDRKNGGKKTMTDMQNPSHPTAGKLPTESVRSVEPSINGGSMIGTVSTSSPRLEMRQITLSQVRQAVQVPSPAVDKSPSDNPAIKANLVVNGITESPDTIAQRILVCPSPFVLPDLLGSASAVRTMETMLVECVRLNYTLGKHGREGKPIQWTIKIEKIRSFAEEIAELEYDKAMYALKKENAIAASKSFQARYNQTIFWEVITGRAKFLDTTTLPTSKGRLDDFTPAEKAATKMFMVEAGYGISSANQRRYRKLWKSLSDMRKSGVDKVLLYRTTEFDNFCKEYPDSAENSLTDIVSSWETLYGPHISQLEDRAREEGEGDRTGRLLLRQPCIAERLNVSETLWNCADNQWFSSSEKEDFKAKMGSMMAPDDQLGGLYDIGATEGMNRNKALFVSVFASGEESLSLRPITTIYEGDYMGTFGGMIRFSDNFDSTYGVLGPREKLWLDYSKATGLLNQMQVSNIDTEANVHIQWELFEELHGEKVTLEWRVAVRALRTIKPFETIVRVTRQEKQYRLHQEAHHARAGFIKQGV